MKFLTLVEIRYIKRQTVNTRPVQVFLIYLLNHITIIIT